MNRERSRGQSDASQIRRKSREWTRPVGHTSNLALDHKESQPDLFGSVSVRIDESPLSANPCDTDSVMMQAVCETADK